MCLQIELRIAGLSGPVLCQAHQFLAVALSLGQICQIQLLYLRTAGNGRKLSHANAADHLLCLVQRNEVGSLFGCFGIVLAHVVQLRVKIGRSRNVQLKLLQIRANDLGQRCIIRRSDRSVV